MELAGTDMDMESAITNLIEGKSLVLINEYTFNRLNQYTVNQCTVYRLN